MRTQCNYVPDTIWVRDIENNLRRITIRKNIEEDLIAHEDDNETMYSFDEVDVLIPDRYDIEQFANDNIDQLFELGIQQNAELNIYNKKLQETEHLIRTGQLVDDMKLIGQQLTNILLEVL